MSYKPSVYSKYFWNLNERALKETEKILKNPKHPKFIARMITFLSRCQDPKELFSLVSQEEFVKAWPGIKSYWKKVDPQSDFRDWWRADRKSTRLNSSHTDISRMPSSA